MSDAPQDDAPRAEASPAAPPPIDPGARHEELDAFLVQLAGELEASSLAELAALQDGIDAVARAAPGLPVDAGLVMEALTAGLELALGAEDAGRLAFGVVTPQELAGRVSRLVALARKPEEASS